MAAFDIEVSSPVAAGFTAGLGGPHVGTHTPPAKWYIEYGMDLGAQEGSTVRAAFDGHVTVFHPHDPATDTSRIYGAQIFVRAPNDMMGGFYTHMKDVPAGLGADSAVSRGDELGSVLQFPGTAPHLHMALVEILGGAPAPDDRYRGVDNMYDFFLETARSDAATDVRFQQDGSPPVVGNGGDGGGPAPLHLATVRGVQQGLVLLGYSPGVVDGIDGPNTRAAVIAFQADHGLPQTGQCTDVSLATLASLLIAGGHQVDGV